MVIGIAMILVMAVEGQPMGQGLGVDWWRPNDWWIYNRQDHHIKTKVCYNTENPRLGDHIILALFYYGPIL
jgi:hypothetical protein